jgi:DNA-binding XRE family transcriptional regulator
MDQNTNSIFEIDLSSGGEMRKNKIRQLREAIPLSITKLARMAGLVPQTIAKMEKGLPTRRNSKLKIAKALQKQYEEVFISDEDA